MGNKHYIRLDNQSRIVKGFSDLIEQPLETDICINKDASSQFMLLGNQNPPLIDFDRCHLYKYVNSEILETTEAEKQAELADLPLPEPTETEKLRADIEYLSAMTGVTL